MIKNRNIVFLLTNIILGLGVILSYLWGIIYNDDPSLLWGRVNENHIPYIVLSMLLGAIGYLIFSSFFLYIKKLNSLTFKQFKYLINLYICILFPSSLWMPLSVLYLNTGNKLILVTDLLCLYIVGLSSLLLTKFIIDNKIENSMIWKLSVIGGLQFVFHTLILDAVYWGINFV